VSIANRHAPIPTIKGLIFDCDGLLLDTEMPAFQSWQEVYAQHGCDLPLAEWAACLGGSGAEFDACAYLEELLGRPVDREGIRARRLQRKLELVASQPLLPGVLDCITGGKRLGLKLGVASSSPRDWVAGHLDRLGIERYFDAVVCAGDVARVKPFPDLYETVLAALHLQPEEAIVFEDSPNGIVAAKAAGIFCVAVPNPLTCQLPLGAPDLRLASMADLPLEQLLAQVEERSRVA
jgi:HAD superfamily hydrolase (TIGR01509 family)